MPAQKHRVHVVGGSIPEAEGGLLYNTCAVFNRDGVLVAKHRKVGRWPTLLVLGCCV